MNRRTFVPVLLPLLALLVLLPGVAIAEDSYEPNDNRQEAYGPLEPQTSYTSWISEEGDFDWYYLDVGPGEYEFLLTSLPPSEDYDLIYWFEDDTIPNEEAISDNPPGQAEVLSGTFFVSTRVWISVEPISGSFDPEDSYVLTVDFTPLADHPPTVDLLSPDGGEIWETGSTHDITWTAEDAEDGTDLFIDLAYTDDAGDTWTDIATSIPNSGSFSWMVPDSPTLDAAVRVTARDTETQEATDESEGYFTIEVPAGSAVLDVTGSTSRAGEEGVLDVDVDHDRPLTALSLSLVFDPGVLVLASVEAASRATGLSLETSQTDAGSADIVLTGGPGNAVPSGSGALLRLSFLTSPVAGGASPVTVVEASATDDLGRAFALETRDGALTLTDPVDPDLLLSLPDVEAAPEETFDVPVGFASNLSVRMLSFAVVYDPAEMTPVEVVPGERGSEETLNTDLDEEGKVTVLVEHDPLDLLPPGEGTLAILTFRRPAGAAGTASLTFEGAGAEDVAGTGLPVQTQDGEVTRVELLSFTAAAVPEGVRLRWSADADGSHAGYRILRGPAADEAGGANHPPATAVHEGLLPPDADTYLDRTVPAGGTWEYWLVAVDRSGFRQRFGPLAVDVPVRLWVGIPVPNPSPGAVRLDLRLPGDARALVLDLQGRVVRRLPVPAGAVELTWDGRTETGALAPAGIYFLRVGYEGGVESRRVVLRR